jgi:hypothetical protein
MGVSPVFVVNLGLCSCALATARFPVNSTLLPPLSATLIDCRIARNLPARHVINNEVGELSAELRPVIKMFHRVWAVSSLGRFFFRRDVNCQS